MSELLVKPSKHAEDGQIIHITPASAGWKYVGFDVFDLKVGAMVTQETGDREVVVVLVRGHATVGCEGLASRAIGARMSPFDGAPWSMYVPPHTRYTIVATDDVELGICSAPAKGGLPPRFISPDEVKQETRGAGANLRHVRHILPETEPAESLLVVESVTPAGNWSSYPPHRHDTDNGEQQTYLEETYYHRVSPPQGFAIQRVYTDDRSLDETLAAYDKHVVLVPRGYHPVAAAHGYDLYYLNVMAGPRRAWHVHNEPAHEWLLQPGASVAVDGAR
ncbi:5-deoxy-glucuronate isomerase [Paraburkholderia sediminicola]|uniref:5-deoxy-glucuronate isomerase n=1 Tax=Paraburkholderia TaxID=1822464 RepID=UPI0038B86E14